MKKIIGLVFVGIMVCGILSGCSGDADVEAEKSYQETLMQQANDEVGMPEVTEFYEKKLAKEIFEKRDDSKLVCYAYSQNLEGKFIYVGKCMGYGLPYSTQYTNPTTIKEFGVRGGWSDIAVPQADPNGLYGADGLDATWLMMINEDSGEPYIMYCEPTIVVTEVKIPKRLISEWSLPDTY